MINSRRIIAIDDQFKATSNKSYVRRTRKGIRQYLTYPFVCVFVVMFLCSCLGYDHLMGVSREWRGISGAGFRWMDV